MPKGVKAVTGRNYCVDVDIMFYICSNVKIVFTVYLLGVFIDEQCRLFREQPIGHFQFRLNELTQARERRFRH